MVSATESTTRVVSASPDGRVRAYRERGLMYVEADHDHRHGDVVAMLEYLATDGWLPVPEAEAEAELTDDGVRIEFRKNRLGTKVITGLLSTPLLMGLGALTASVEYWLPVVRVVAA